ncbi:unnamed protein product [Amoebophrya sp. A25]|nr:unnamed protein product [Amoebophrya sp. A25]|eukprot:GSA25T00000768001.1
MKSSLLKRSWAQAPSTWVTLILVAFFRDFLLRLCFDDLQATLVGYEGDHDIEGARLEDVDDEANYDLGCDATTTLSGDGRRSSTCLQRQRWSTQCGEDEDKSVVLDGDRAKSTVTTAIISKLLDKHRSRRIGYCGSQSSLPCQKKHILEMFSSLLAELVASPFSQKECGAHSRDGIEEGSKRDSERSAPSHRIAERGRISRTNSTTSLSRRESWCGSSSRGDEENRICATREPQPDQRRRRKCASSSLYRAKPHEQEQLSSPKSTSTSSSLFVSAYPFFPRLPCKRYEGEMFKMHTELEELVQDFMQMYDNYADPVIEVMDAVVLHQIQSISESFLKIVESYRLILSTTLCAEVCHSGGPDSYGTYWIDHWITELHRNVEVISEKDSWREQVRLFMFDTWTQIREWLERVVSSGRIQEDDFAQVVGGAREIYTGMIRPAFSILVTQNSHNMSHILTIGKNTRTQTGWLQGDMPHHNVLHLMEQPRKTLRSPNLLLKSDVCQLAERNGESSRDILHSGALEQDSDIMRIMKQIGAHVPLSHAFVGWRLGDMDPELTDCKGRGIFYDPINCLEAEGWGGYVFRVTIRSEKAEVIKVPKSQRSSALIHPLGKPDLYNVLPSIDLVWTQMVEFSPDLFFIHPGTENCRALQELFMTGPINPKVVVIPFNPLIPPPFEVIPLWPEFWAKNKGILPQSRMFNTSLPKDYVTPDDLDSYIASLFFKTQCSLAGVQRFFETKLYERRRKFILHSIDGAFLTYIRADLRSFVDDLAVQSVVIDNRDDVMWRMWLDGWYCNPYARYYARLEMTSLLDMQRLADPEVDLATRTDIVCDYLSFHRIHIARKRFDCWRLHMLPNARGWGGNGEERWFSTPGACQRHCRMSPGCRFWTFDPVGHYGTTLCWVWIDNEPDEIKDEPGWWSGRQIRDISDQIASSQLPVVTEAMLRKWAVNDWPEVGGLRYLLERQRRGRCTTQGFCECFPPYRGPVCQHEHSSRFPAKPFKAILHYLVDDLEADVNDLTYSLPRLWDRYNKHHDYDVVLFHDGMSAASRSRIVESSENRVWFAYVEDFKKVDESVMRKKKQKARLKEVKWSIGYRGMCKFRSGTMFFQPVMDFYEYAMTLDTDGYFPQALDHDPIEKMWRGNYTYTWSHLLPDQPGAVRHFWSWSLMFFQMKNIDWRTRPLLQDFIRPEDLEWNYNLYMNDIEINKLSFFRSEKYQEYFRYLDSFNGFFLYRWGDHALRTIAVGMYLEPKDVMQMRIPYGHQGYCQCLSGDVRCYPEERYYAEMINLTEKPSYYRDEWRICAPPIPSATERLMVSMKDEDEEEVKEATFVAGENPMRDASDVFSASRNRRDAERRANETNTETEETQQAEGASESQQDANTSSSTNEDSSEGTVEEEGVASTMEKKSSRKEADKPAKDAGAKGKRPPSNAEARKSQRKKKRRRT